MSRFFCLTPVLGGPGAPRYPVSVSSQIIGRSEEADIALLEPTVSRKHASISLEAESIWLEDMESKHGTFVNSKRITRHRLKVGDLIVIGLSIVLRLEESDTEVPPAEALRMPTPARLRAPEPRLGTSEQSSPSSGQYQRSMRSDTALSWTVESKQRQTRELRRVKEDLVRARKLASIGAYCITKLPELYERVASLLEGARTADAGQPTELVQPNRLTGELEAIYSVLERLVTVSRTLPPHQVRVVRLEDPLRMALAMVGPEAETDGHELRLEMTASPEVRADPRRLALALRHLLYSALQSAHQGTALMVQVQELQDRAQVSITNTGDGIPGEVLSEIFDPYLTSGNHWLRYGLGLFEARQIVMSFGGSVEMDGEPGKGIEIRALIPLARLTSAAASR